MYDGHEKPTTLHPDRPPADAADPDRVLGGVLVSERRDEPDIEHHAVDERGLVRDGLAGRELIGIGRGDEPDRRVAGRASGR